MSERAARAMERARKAKESRQRLILWVGGVCLVLILLGLGLSFLIRGSDEAARPVDGTASTDRQEKTALRAIIEEGGAPVAKSEAEAALETIEDHRARLEANPAAPEAPGLLSAMASLHRHKRGDYQRAAQCYEDILAEYPDWDGIGGIYPLLAACYSRMDNAEYLKWTYQRMMEYYPEDAQEYLYAKSELGL